MVKKKKTGSQSIRDVLAKNPKATPSEILAVLTSKGVKVSDALIRKVKYYNPNKPAAAKAPRGAGAGGPVKKADAIRDTFGQLGPAARPRDVIADLASRGILVSSAQVSNIRSAMKKHGGMRRTMSSAASRTGGGAYSAEQLVAAKGFADRVGGIDAARCVLDVLAKLR